MFSLIKRHFTCPEIDRFEGVDFETFISLEPNDIKEVIPELIPRLNFGTQYKKYLRTINLQAINESDMFTGLVVVESRGFNAENPTKNYTGQSVLESLPTNDFLSSVVQSLSPQDTVDNSSVVAEGTSIDAGNASGIETYRDRSTIELNEFDLTDTRDIEINNASKHQNSLPATQYINSAQDIMNIPSIEMKIIAKRYTQKPLDNADRILVGKEIIRHLLLPNPERVIAKVEFMQIAENIVTLFPNEIAGCYYTERQGKMQPQGKLYTAYIKLKAKLQEVGLIDKQPKSKSAKKATKEALRDNEQSVLKSVSMETDDFEKLKRSWTMSYKERFSNLLPKLKTVDYLNMFPAFNQPEGFELLTIDASIRFPNMNSSLPEISRKLFIFASRLKNRSLDVNVLIKEFNDLKRSSIEEQAIAEAQQQLLALKLLPHLLKVNHKRKGKSDAKVSLYSSYKSIAEATKNDGRSDDALPYLNLIEETSIPQAQLVIAGRKFLIDDPLMAFDVLFKSFLALSLNYPDECQHLWLFVQKSIYNVHKSTDLKLSNVTTLIRDISNLSND